MQALKPYTWFPLLVPSDNNINSNSVIGSIDNEELKSCCIIRMEDKRGKSSYAVFQNYVVLCRYIQSIYPDARRFHEVSLGNIRQKPRFDIDIREDRITIPLGLTLDEHCKLLIDELIDLSIEVLAERKHILNIEEQVLIYTSHGEEEGFQKRSYHVILDMICHSNCRQAKKFFEDVASKATPSLLEVIDANIYHKNHCMRLIWNHKLGSNRVKQFANTFNYKGVEITHKFKYGANSENHRISQIFGSSLISMTFQCEVLADIEDEGYYDEPTVITTAQSMEAMALMCKYCNTTPDALPFKYLGTKGSIVSLKRLRMSPCPVCIRPHLNRPPYLLIQGNLLYWCCSGLTKEYLFVHEEVDKKRNDRTHIGYMASSMEVSREAAADIVTNKPSLKLAFDRISRYVDSVEEFCVERGTTPAVPLKAIVQPPPAVQCPPVQPPPAVQCPPVQSPLAVQCPPVQSPLTVQPSSSVRSLSISLSPSPPKQQVPLRNPRSNNRPVKIIIRTEKPLVNTNSSFTINYIDDPLDNGTEYKEEELIPKSFLEISRELAKTSFSKRYRPLPLGRV